MVKVHNEETVVRTGWALWSDEKKTSREQPKSAPYLRLNKLCEFLGKNLKKKFLGKIKTLYPNIDNVISELWKRYIPTLKTLYANFEGVISE